MSVDSGHIQKNVIAIDLGKTFSIHRHRTVH